MIRRTLSFLRGLLSVETHPACPICGKIFHVKTMPLHLSGHKAQDPDVVRWRNEQR